MNQLYTYIEAINRVDGKVFIVSQVVTDNSYKDQGVAVNSYETIFSFSNGVVLKYDVEFDEVPLSSEVCAECWISYEIIDSLTETISPTKKTFVNKCQESFWLKMQKHRAM